MKKVPSFEQYVTPEKPLLHDGLVTLEETLRGLPVNIGLLIEVKFPNEEFSASKHLSYPERNTVVDNILKVFFIIYLLLYYLFYFC